MQMQKTVLSRPVLDRYQNLLILGSELDLHVTASYSVINTIINICKQIKLLFGVE